MSPDTDRHRPESAHKPDDARAGHFAPKWQPKSALYLKYMASEKPANKRMFHLVYGRSLHAGGAGHDGPDHVKNQVVEVARDLPRLMRAFAGRSREHFDPRLNSL